MKALPLAGAMLFLVSCSKPAFEPIDAALTDAAPVPAKVAAAPFPAATAKLALTLTGHKENIHSLAYSPDGALLASAGYGDSTVRLWRADSGQEVSRAATERRPSSLAWMPDGSALMVSDVYGRLTTYPVASGQLGAPQIAGTTLKDNGGIKRIAIHPNGKLLAAVGFRKPILLWDIAGGREVRTVGEAQPLHSVAFSADGKTLGVIGDGTSFRTFDLRTRVESVHKVPKVGEGSAGCGIAFAPGGKHMAVGFNDATFSIWRTPGMSELHNHFINPGSVMGLAFSPDGTQLATIQASLGVYLWEAESRTLVTSFMHPEQIESIAFRPDGSALALGVEDGRILIYR